MIKLLVVILLASAAADAQIIQEGAGCYTNVGAIRYKKRIRVNREGAIENVIPPPKTRFLRPKVTTATSGGTIFAKLERKLLSYDQSAYQQMPARVLFYNTWVAEEKKWVLNRIDLNDLICAAAKEQGLDPLVISLIVSRESAGDPQATSPVGACGLMQLMPDTAKMLGVTDVNDPTQNVMGGTKYFADLYRKYGDLQLALAAYNAGPTCVDACGGIPPYHETLSYVQSIVTEYGQRKKRRTT